jgi:hypothetical protein
MSGDEPKTLRLALSVDMMELMWAVLRDSQKKVRFAFRGEFGGPINQLRLF